MLLDFAPLVRRTVTQLCRDAEDGAMCHGKVYPRTGAGGGAGRGSRLPAQDLENEVTRTYN